MCNLLLLFRTDFIVCSGTIKGRVQFYLKNYAEAEQYFLSALQAERGMCNLGVDITVTQRKLGPRLGLGRMFSGICGPVFDTEISTLRSSSYRRLPPSSIRPGLLT